MIIHIPHDGVVKELMYEVDDTATRGKPLLMIELEGEEEEGEEEGEWVGEEGDCGWWEGGGWVWVGGERESGWGERWLP